MPKAREVSPLELFCDLVFVFAVSQLFEHLLHDLTWRGAAETLVLLCAEFTVWLLTTFEATYFGSEPVTLTWHPSGSAAGFHKSANVLSALPKSAHPGAMKALAETWGANPIWVDLRHRPASAQGHQGSGLAGGRAGHGVQAHRVGPSPLACGERTPPRRPRPRRGEVHRRPTRRTTGRISRPRSSRTTRRMTG
jgi:hypothetical protein